MYAFSAVPTMKLWVPKLFLEYEEVLLDRQPCEFLDLLALERQLLMLLLLLLMLVLLLLLILLVCM